MIKKFQKVLKENQQDGVVTELGACFCKDSCQDGVIVLINGKKHVKVTPEMVAGLLAEGAGNDN